MATKRAGHTHLVGNVDLAAERAHSLHDRQQTVPAAGVQRRLTQHVDDVRVALRVQQQQRDAHLTALAGQVQRRVATLLG